MARSASSGISPGQDGLALVQCRDRGPQGEPRSAAAQDAGFARSARRSLRAVDGRPENRARRPAGCGIRPGRVSLGPQVGFTGLRPLSLGLRLMSKKRSPDKWSKNYRKSDSPRSYEMEKAI